MSQTQLSMLGNLWLNAYYESMDRYFVSAAPRDVGSFCEAAYELMAFFERSPSQALLVQQLALRQMTIGGLSAPCAAVVLLGETASLAALVKPLDREAEAAATRELLLARSQMEARSLFDGLDHLNRCRSYLTDMVSTPFGRWATAKEANLRGHLSVKAFELQVAEKYYREAHEHATSLLSDGSALNEFAQHLGRADRAFRARRANPEGGRNGSAVAG
jgi:hypothetical protein